MTTPMLEAPRESAVDKGFRFWETKQGTATMGLGALALAALGFLLYKISPFLVVLFQNLMTAVGFALATTLLVVVLFSLLYFLSRKNVRLAFTYWCENQARRVMRAVVDADPIGSAKTALGRMRRRLDEMKQRLVVVVRERKRLEAIITENNENREFEMQLAQKALQKEDQEQSDAHAASAGDYEESNRELLRTLKGLSWVQDVLERVSKSLDLRMQGFEKKIAIKERELKAKLAGQAAVSAARSALSGDDKAMFDESVDSISQQIAQAEASIESFFNDALPMLQADDLGTAVKNDKARVALERWINGQEKSPDTASLLSSNDARQLRLSAGMAPAAALPTGEKAAQPVPTQGGYSDFFGGSK